MSLIERISAAIVGTAIGCWIVFVTVGAWRAIYG